MGGSSDKRHSKTRFSLSHRLRIWAVTLSTQASKYAGTYREVQHNTIVKIWGEQEVESFSNLLISYCFEESVVL